MHIFSRNEIDHCNALRFDDFFLILEPIKFQKETNRAKKIVKTQRFC